MIGPTSRRNLAYLLAVGLVAFLLGLTLALAQLPEWRQQPLPGPDVFVDQLRTFQNQAGLTAPSCVPHIELTSPSTAVRETYRLLGTAAAERLVIDQRALTIKASLLTQWNGSPLGHTTLNFSGTGTIWAFSFIAADISGSLPNTWRDDRTDHHQDLAEAITDLDFGDLGEPVSVSVPGGPKQIYTLPRAGEIETDEIETLSLLTARNWATEGHRRTGSLDQVKSDIESRDLSDSLLQSVPLVCRFLLAFVLFIILAFRRRLGLVSAAMLAAPVFLISFSAAVSGSFSGFIFFTSLSAAIFKTLFVFVLWAGAESWVRSTIPSFSTSLDALRGGYLGPRGGRSLLGGWAAGAGLAGLSLMLFSLAAALPGVHPGGSSVPLPIFGLFHSPLSAGVLSAGFVLLALAACRNLLAQRWRVPVASILAGILNLPQVELHPWYFALPVSLIFGGLLVLTFERFGTTGLLTAALVQSALPAAVFSAFHFSWMPWSFAATALFCLAVPILGWVGLSRSGDAESARMVAPAYVRRLEEERRVKYEVELLARMQKGLLPESTPDIDGYQLAATSILAHEAGGDLYDFLSDEEGGLWVAAGDVSGHGFSCTIEHAMTKAALTSLVKAGQRPSEILHQVDGLRRTARSVRSFTSLSLLRLEPETGRVVFSNAGHPYPIMLDGQDLSEISLPSLPLGQGPKRQYIDQTLMLREGAALVLLSDGLFESTDAAGRAYGYPRTRQVLKEHIHLSAKEILGVLIADWRRHIGSGAPADDTTLVVLKRLAQR